MKKWWKGMKKQLHAKWSELRNEIASHKFIYFLLALCLLGGLFIRTYRTDQILGFYYDQGRDAMEIWELWHEGDVFLIGPTTGIASAVYACRGCYVLFGQETRRENDRYNCSSSWFIFVLHNGCKSVAE